MKIYEIEASETVFYKFKINAKDKDDAWDKALNNNATWKDVVASSDFRVEKVIEFKKL